MEILLIALGGAVVLGLGFWLMVPVISPRPDTLGVTDGQLAACDPLAENCVSTQSDSVASPRMTPLSFNGLSMSDSHRALVSMLQGMERVTIVTNRPDYIHAEFRSGLWRFVDDTEFYLDAEAQMIHFRSAARLGKGDMGVNKKRMQDISARWQAQTGG